MNMKFFSAVAAVAIGFASEAALADDAPAAAAPAAAAPAAPTPEFTITGAAAIVSQYKFRGITQSDSKPAVQATFTVSDKSGFYISMWGSSGAGDRSDDLSIYVSPNNGTEIDVFGGYTHTFAKSGITLDGGLYGYIYPNRTANNLFEVYGDISKSYGPISLKAGLNWAPKQHYFTFFDTATKYSMYEYGNIGYTPTKVPALNFHGEVGHTGGGLDFGKDYIDYSFGVGYKWKALTFDISGVGTNISHHDANRFADAFFGTSEGEGGPASAYVANSFYRYGKLAPVASITASF